MGCSHDNTAFGLSKGTKIIKSAFIFLLRTYLRHHSENDNIFDDSILLQLLNQAFIRVGTTSPSHRISFDINLQRPQSSIQNFLNQRNFGVFLFSF